VKKLGILSFAIVLGVFTISAFTLPEKVNGTYNVDTKNSTVKWKGAKLTGEHVGNIQIDNGSLEVSNGTIKGGSFEIDMTTLANEDLEGEYRDKLVNHLKSDDFFGVEKYPKAKFVITNVESQGNDNYLVTGDLTIKATTKKIEFPATITAKEDAVTASAQITVDRSEYDVRFGSSSFFDNLGDKVIYDDFNLDVTLVAHSELGK
jgi:polyisoprenoid-binding protein YceI